MIRTKGSNALKINERQGRDIGKQISRIQTFEALLSRAQLAAKLGYQYGTSRDLYEALGYVVQLEYAHFAAKYERQDIAKAVIDRPVNATWRGEFGIIESEVESDTALEKAWKELDEILHLKSYFVRADKISTLGSYGVLLLGFSDAKTRDDLKTPVKKGNGLKLLYLKPLSQENAKIGQWEQDSSNPRYCMPTIYNVTLKNPGGSTTSNIDVHWTRIIHITGELLESDTDGVPGLQAIYNRLDDLEKLVGSSAEMFWRGGRPGYTGKVDTDAALGDTEKAILQDQIDEYEHNLRRFLLMEGVELKGMEVQISDPRWHVDVQIQMISATTGIPKRILVGSERGELASSEDRSTWLELIQDRREGYAELQIVRPFVDRLMEYGALPKAGTNGYKVLWEDIFAPSEKEQVEVGKNRATAIKEYSTNPDAKIILPVAAFLRVCLGLPQEEIDQITQEHEAALKEEEEQLKREEALAAEQDEANLEEEPMQRTNPAARRNPNDRTNPVQSR